MPRANRFAWCFGSNHWLWQGKDITIREAQRITARAVQSLVMVPEAPMPMGEWVRDAVDIEPSSLRSRP